MKILLIHISDLHLISEDDITNFRIEKFIDALSVYRNISKCFVFLSGDITNSGKKVEFDIAKKFTRKIKKEIGNKLSIGEIKFYIVPGNHDLLCNNDSYSRSEILEGIKHNIIGKLLENNNKKMDNFFNFVRFTNCFRNNKSFEHKKIILDLCSIGINLINSSYFSEISDDKGIHFINQQNIDEIKRDREEDLIISIMHHPTDWFETSIKNNLESAIYKKSNIVLLGHEHDSKEYLLKINDKYHVNILHGGPFYDRFDKNNSEFYSIVFDSDKRMYDVDHFKWICDMDFYKKNIESTNNKIYNDELIPNEDAISKIYSDDKFDTTQKFTEYFVFPNVNLKTEKIPNERIECFDSYFNEIKINKKILINGSENSGKTTLLKRIYIEFLENGFAPIFFRAEDFQKSKVEKIIKEAFNEQFFCKEDEYSKFTQMKKSKKVAIIDNLQMIKQSSLDNFILGIESYFDFIVASVDSSYDLSIKTIANNEVATFSEYLQYEICCFYSTKRQELIKKVFAVYSDENSVSVDEFSNRINQLYKSHLNEFELTPFYIIQFIKFVIDQNSFNLNENKIFGQVFQSNLVNSIRTHSSKNFIDSYFEVLSRIAYYIHSQKLYPLPEKDLMNIITDYNDKYGQKIGLAKFITTMLKAKVFKQKESNYFKFSNNFQLAFFVAKEIIRRNYDEEENECLKLILENLCFGINSEILLFISYLNSNIKVLDYIFNEAVLFFENIEEFNIIDDGDSIFRKFSYQVNMSIPTEEDKKKLNKREDIHEEYISNNGIIEIENIYNYDESQKNLLFNKVIKALKLTQIIAKILPEFDSKLVIEKKVEYVKRIYSYPNKILYILLKDLDDNFDEYYKELFEIIIKNNDLTEEEIDFKIKKKISDIVTSIIPGIYKSTALMATNYNTIKFFDEYLNQNNLNNRLQNLIMHETINNHSDFSIRAHQIYCDKQAKKYIIVRTIIQKIIYFYLINNKDIPYKNKQRLLECGFNEKIINKKLLITKK